jgi:hypothetical protein
MVFPANSVLMAAARWMALLKNGDLGQARMVIATVPMFRDLTQTQYELGLHWLSEVGLLGDCGPAAGVEPGFRVLERALIHDRPLWINLIDQDTADEGDFPSDLMGAAMALGLDEQHVLAAVRSVTGRFDDEARRKLGALGEVELVELLMTVTSGEVRHVARLSDAFGYDIEWARGERMLRLEVKTTSRGGELVFYLSRNEYEVARREPDWRLLVLFAPRGESVEAIVTVDRSWILANGPSDSLGGAVWESARFRPTGDVLAVGIFGLNSGIGDYDSFDRRTTILGSSYEPGNRPSWWPSNSPGFASRGDQS